MASIDFFQTPIFIIVFNRLEALRPVVSWLEQAGYKNIHLIDNASTYPPLLDYLAASPHHVHTMQENHGHLVLWKSGQFDHIIQHQPFVLNDCDVLPSKNCPADVVERLAAILARYKNFTKVGLSLHIDDLPAHYAHKQQVIEWETPFWSTPSRTARYSRRLLIPPLRITSRELLRMTPNGGVLFARHRRLVRTICLGM
ncbi:hypothetical protein PAEH1_07285 [Paenalcaligenes hominis]|uniref:Glycosyltransferase 2-like domain-containing protein n=1 Tax=Paenalcaligenes hominis TaxID=643674 RepID=A0A1U9K043_9BURK|nr:hypothetical protein [Paenalcaligenes hominis]AQS51406.1 hypothetical protein PAEH1_07285 [Paenalcaligenes hominis]